MILFVYGIFHMVKTSYGILTMYQCLQQCHGMEKFYCDMKCFIFNKLRILDTNDTPSLIATCNQSPYIHVQFNVCIMFQMDFIEIEILFSKLRILYTKEAKSFIAKHFTIPNEAFYHVPSLRIISIQSRYIMNKNDVFFNSVLWIPEGPIIPSRETL